MLYVFYITTTPYLSCNNKNINRKKLYDFYYTAKTLTTGYNTSYNDDDIIYHIRSSWTPDHMYSVWGPVCHPISAGKGLICLA